MKEPNFVDKKYLVAYGYDQFIEYLTNENSLISVTVGKLIEKNIQYYEQTGWDKFIGLSSLVNFVGGVETIQKIASEHYDYNILFIENVANIIDFEPNDTLAINKVEYIKLT